MNLKLAFVPMALAAPALPASAQYIPGLQTPTDTADGFEQMLATACPIAVIGEELPGFTKDHPQEDAILVVSALPIRLAPYVSPGSSARIMKIPNPGDDLYAIYEAELALCTVISMTDAGPIRRQLIDPLTESDAWPMIADPGKGFTHGFIYDFAGVTKLNIRFALPDTQQQPVIATVSLRPETPANSPKE